MNYDAVIFDNDGVLTTPTELAALRRAISMAFEAVGVVNPSADDVDTLISPEVEDLRAIGDRYDIDIDDLWKQRELAAIDVQREEILAGRKKLYQDVSALTTLDQPLAIVSNNQQRTVETIVEHFELERFDPVLGREPTISGIERKKPTPYYLERAIASLDADQPLFVGDSEVDVMAASACAIDSAFIRRAHTDASFDGSTPTYEIDSLKELPGLIGDRSG